MKKILALLCVVWLSASCLPIALGYIEQSMRNQEIYKAYVTSAEKINMERQQKGLTQVPIMSYDEWWQYNKFRSF